MDYMKIIFFLDLIWEDETTNSYVAVVQLSYMQNLPSVYADCCLMIVSNE